MGGIVHRNHQRDVVCPYAHNIELTDKTPNGFAVYAFYFAHTLGRVNNEIVRSEHDIRIGGQNLDRQLDLLGHRIGRGAVTSGVMSAFSRAIERGYAIELDLHLTSDGEVVVFHDDNLKRICGVDSAIWEHTYEELRQLRLQGTDERIPLFTDVLKLVDGRVPLLIELKLPTRNMTLCREAWRILRNYDGPFLIQSFNTFGLRWFRRHAPRIPRGQLSSDLTRERHHSESKVSYIPCVLGKYLLCNALGRPDFISYRYSCSHNLSFWLNRKLFRAGSAVWTIRGEALREKLATRFDMPASCFRSCSGADCVYTSLTRLRKTIARPKYRESGL